MTSDALSEQATRAAWLYYERGLNQEQIARRMAVSRSTISRLLTHAREAGIVEISVNRPLPEVADLENALYERFSLELVVVEPREADESPAEAAARAGARFLSRRARAGGVMGIGWGTTLRAAAQHVTRSPARGVTLIDVVGRPPAEDSLVAVSRLLAMAWSVEAASIPAPAFAATRKMRADLLRNPVVERSVKRAQGADVIVLSVGGTDSRTTLVKEGVVSPQNIRKLRKAGAVGDMLGHFYDASGSEVSVPGLVSPIGLDLAGLREARLVVAIAAGKQKVEALWAAANASLIGGLVTDDGTARALLHS